MGRTVRRNDERSRYELVDGDRVLGIAEFSLTGTTAVFPHTEIDPSQRGGGLGAVLVRAALDDARAQGWSVEPACWFVAEFIDAHPGYADLRAS